MAESDLNELIMNMGCDSLLKSLCYIATVGKFIPPGNYGNSAELESLKKYGLVSVMENDTNRDLRGGIFLTELGEKTYNELISKINGIEK